MTQSALDRLAEIEGIIPEYTDIWGRRHVVSAGTKRAILAAMGLCVEDETSIEATLAEREERPWKRLLPPAVVSKEKKTPLIVPVCLPAGLLGGELSWKLVTESGGETGGSVKPAALDETGRRTINGEPRSRRLLVIEAAPDPGYHRLELSIADMAASTSLIVAPAACYTPPALEGNGRVWGVSAQIYSLRSRRCWGIGDYTCLKTLTDQVADAGGDIIGVNPLHALFPHNPEACSPYSPSSRLFLNVMYIDAEAAPEFSESEAARRMTRSPDFARRLRAAQRSGLVDYAEAANLKKAVLDILYEEFRRRHLDPRDDRGRAFRAFQSEGGEALFRHALFEAIQESLHTKDKNVWGWPVWPVEYRDPDSPAVAKFAEENALRVEFYQYLQWLAAAQLDSAGGRAMERKLGAGLFLDLAVSVDRGGAEVWANQKLYAHEAGIGAPPDDFSLNGQNWGLPPMIPEKLTESAYTPFIATLRANMKCAGALRIDHVMGLMRLFWIPPGGSPADGAYVAYPFEDLLGIVALESARNRCLVVGEDLGTVPDEAREGLKSIGALSYRLLYFEKDDKGDFKRPSDYPREAAAAVTTHDLPTLAGYWEGRDLALRAELGLFPSPESRETQTVERARDRARLLVALDREGLLPEGYDLDPAAAPRMTIELAAAVSAYLARSPSKVAIVQLEDVLGMTEQTNLPGAAFQYPNWRRKLAVLLEDFAGDERLARIAARLAAEGRKQKPAPRLPEAAIPRATYRLQMNRDFNFARAAGLVPYLGDLGISHVYTSPLLKARPGSAHGYDVVDHGSLNPEMGGDVDFERFAGSLREHGMGLVLDLVPNHMGVMGADNAWWLDLLENGPASAWAEYFDVDWEPVKEELRGKVLIPVLAGHYGEILEKGELKLVFDAAEGSFSVYYHDHRFPIDPREYPRILRRAAAPLAPGPGAESPQLAELHSLITAFSKLPPRLSTARGKRGERDRDKEVNKRRLVRLCAEFPGIRAGIEETVAELNGAIGDPESFSGLHQLLEAQGYRLAYWRVAADEINYRRFFDINDLAGLRMENEDVFEATSALALRLVGSGAVCGLRIDHPDGLYDPRRYFERLQSRAADSIAGAGAEKPPGARPVYLVAEKILALYERLPEDWPVHGTIGYEFAGALNGLFIDPSAEKKMSRVYEQFIGGGLAVEDVLYEGRKTVMRMSMASELNVLANQLSRLSEMDWKTRDFTLNGLRAALMEIAACFPVYRTYVTGEGASESDRAYVDWAVARAKRRDPEADATVYGFIRSVLLLDLPAGAGDDYRRAAERFAMRFQQYTAPVMAKGVEDTAFYVYNRLVSLNEVGGDPGRFGLSISAFHKLNTERARRWPHALLCTSTHDTKRSEDVRARINVLPEITGEWKKAAARWKRLNRSKKTKTGAGPAPCANDEYLLYQTITGVYPGGEIVGAELDEFRARIGGYMLKAAREQKANTSWANPNTEYEQALEKFVNAALAPAEKNPFLKDFVEFQKRVLRPGYFNSLSQTLLKLAAPGVPDIYQGNETWDFSLVDPDNRRPVDFERQRVMLDEIKGIATAGDEKAEKVRALTGAAEDGRAKMHLVFSALRLRREAEELFRSGAYIPLAVEGEKRDHLIAFAREKDGALVIAAAPRFFTSLPDPPFGEAAWGGTWIAIPGGFSGSSFANVLTGEKITAGQREGKAALRAADILKNFTAALLKSWE